jgi:transposase-like protein
MEHSARSPWSRPGAEFFTDPADPLQRRYEALRAYLLEGAALADVADRFGYTPAALTSVVRDFRAGRRDFFAPPPRPGPKTAPAKDTARSRIVELRLAGHSVGEISQVLRAEGTPLNRTGVAEVLAAEGFERLWPRPHAQRGLPRRQVLPVAKAADLGALPDHGESPVAGLLLAIPELVALDLPALVQAAGYPGTRWIPAVSSVLSLLALKLTGVRRVSHVEDLAADPGAALFAGLTALPKTAALTSYSYRLDHTKQVRFLAALSRAMLARGLIEGGDFDLDFHAVMHWGHEVALEKHYVPRRSQRTRSVLTFLAQDAATHNLVYACADVTKASQNAEVLAFCDYWRAVTGTEVAQLVFDGRLTTQAQLGALNRRGVRFVTPRTRSPAVIAHIAEIAPARWRTVHLDRDGNYATAKVVDEQVRLSAYPVPIRQLVITGLGHDQPTVLITNDFTATPKKIIERYGRRMSIEQRLGEAIRAFHLDALSSAVPLNIDLDVVLSVQRPARRAHRAAYLRVALRRRRPRVRRARRHPPRPRPMARPPVGLGRTRSLGSLIGPRPGCPGSSGLRAPISSGPVGSGPVVPGQSCPATSRRPGRAIHNQAGCRNSFTATSTASRSLMRSPGYPGRTTCWCT